MGLSAAPVSFRSLGLLVLLVFAACAGGDRLDTPIRAAQRLGTPHWASGATVAVEQRFAVRVSLSWPEAFGAEAPYAYAVYRDGALTQVMPVAVVTDESVAASTTYVYAIAARDVEGRESDVSERLAVTVTTPGPSPAPEWPSGAALSGVRIGRNRAELAWPSGLPVAAGGDVYDECRFELQHRETGAMDWIGDGVLKETPAETEGALVTGLSATTSYEFRVLLTDLEGQPAAVGIASASATTASAGAAFEWASGASASATVVTRSVLRRSWPEGPLDAEFYELERDLGAGFVDWATVPAGFQSATTFEGDGFEPRTAPYDLRVRAVDSGGGTTAWLPASATIALPPTPAPPPPPTTGETSFADRALFLYEAPPGTVPQQTGVAAGTIVPTRSAILTGEVQRRDGAAVVGVSGARITVLGHPEFGETWSRADGLWEMAVNGGTSLVVNIRRSGYLPVQRTVNVPWGEFARVDDVLLTAEAAAVPVALDIDGTVPDGGVGVQGPVVGSGSAQRRAAVFLPAGRTVTACLPGSTPAWCNAQQLTGTLNLSVYDLRGRVATVTRNTRQVTYAYDDAPTTPAERRGRLASVTVASTEPGGPSRTTTRAYNVGDVPRSVRTTSPGDIVHDVALDEAGNMTSLTPPGRTAHTFGYGWRNRPTTHTPPVPSGGGAAADWQTTYAHAVQGMPTHVSRPDGEEFDFSHPDGRLDTVLLPNVAGVGRPSLSFTYDEATGGGSGTGVITSVTHSVNGSLTYGYNFAATGTLPTSETWGVTEAGVTTTRAVSVTYDAFAGFWPPGRRRAARRWP